MSLIFQKYKNFRNDTESLALYECIGFCHNEYTFKEKKCIFKVWIFVYVLIFCLYNNGHMIFVPPKCKHKQTSKFKSAVFCMKGQFVYDDFMCLYICICVIFLDEKSFVYGNFQRTLSKQCF